MTYHLRTVLSLFDGISCGQLALQRAGITYDKYIASEIDPYAIKITQKQFPTTIQVGDVSGIDPCIPNVDLIIGGSPCQGFSVAGKRLNFDDPRSKLFFEYSRLLKEIKPKYFLMENVYMKKEWQDIISEHLGVQPIEINSTLVSAQNRRRLYWTNIPGVTQPQDKGITLKDIIQDGYTDRDKSYAIDANYWKGANPQQYWDKHRRQLVFQDPAIAAIRGRYEQDGSTIQYMEFRYDNKSNALTTVGKDNVVVPYTLPNKVPASTFMYRKLTPIECERLQTIPDNYTDAVSNTRRYTALGNAWTVDVIAHIMSFMV